MGNQIEITLFVISILFFISILASKAGNKFGVPALLLFLAVGMASGVDGLGIEFENLHLTQAISTIALCVILFSGGLDTKIKEIRPVLFQGAILATIGVLLTTSLAGVMIWWVLGMTLESAQIGFITSLLLAATISSTDSASVFSILRNRGLHLKNNLRPMLELESGSNDPMAYILTITLTQIIAGEQSTNFWMVGGSILLQIIIGVAMGYVLGRLSVKAINNIHIHNGALYPILLVTIALFIFSSTYLLKGNAYLAVYIGGLVIGNSQFVNRRISKNFFDGLAWLFQLIMFLTLGLLVNPHELIPFIIPGVIISVALIFVIRPLSVFISLAPFVKMATKDKLFVSWGGLRGAVPIVFAIIPLAAEIPHARLIFNIVFLCTLISLILQGTTLTSAAKWLKLTDNPFRIRKPVNFDLEFSDDIKSVLTEMTVTEETLLPGTQLKHINLPHKTLVILIRRHDRYFVPTGNTTLIEHDKLLIVTDDHEALAESIKKKITQPQITTL